MIKKNLPPEDDWRRQGQEKYLIGIKLLRHNYYPSYKNWDHDHCEFCGEKFSIDKADLNFGYSSLDFYNWICEPCFNDFNEEFKWETEEE